MMRKVYIFVGVVFLLGLVFAIGMIGCGKVVDSSSDSSELKNGTIFTGKNSVKTYGDVRSSSIQTKATSSISGYVYDAVSNSPISGVHIFVDGVIVATSDATGAYTASGVSAGDVTILAVYPVSTYNSSEGRNVLNYSTISVVTKATKIDFYLFPLAEYAALGKGDLEVAIKDDNGNPIEDAWAYFGQVTYKTFPELRGNTTASNSFGVATIASVSAGSIIGTAGKAGLGAGYMTSPIVNSAGGTTTATITIPSNQGTIGGTVALPSGFTLSSANLMPPTTSLPFWYTTSGSVDSSSATYSAMAPAGSNYKLFVSVSGPNNRSCGVIVPNITVNANQTTTNNISTVYESPLTISLVTASATSVLFADVSWTAPTSWTPDGYVVYFFSWNPGVQWYGVTKGTSISIPKFSSLTSTTAVTVLSVFAIKTSSTMDIDNFNILDFDFEQIATISL